MAENDGKKLNNLILSVADGYADCLDGIYEIAGGQMYAIACSIAGREYAEDVLHDSFVKISRFAGRYKDGTNARGWLLKIVRNTALDFVRTIKARTAVSTDELFSLSSDRYSPEKTESAIALEQALSKLEDAERTAIYCTYYLDMSVRETARAMKISKSAVQRILDKAENKLKSLLDGGTN